MVGTLHNSSEKVMNHPRMQAAFESCRRNNVSTFLFSHEDYELPKNLLD